METLYELSKMKQVDGDTRLPIMPSFYPHNVKAGHLLRHEGILKNNRR
jgi:hypothetical protein